MPLSNHPCTFNPRQLRLGLDSSRFILVFLLVILGCAPASPPSENVITWGKQGVGPADLLKPRAIIAGNNELYIVDMTGRIQVFSMDGVFLRQWRAPEVRQGKPCGLGWSNDGLLMVADTHYFRVLFYRPDGTLVEERTIGGENGREPGQFGFVTDVVQDSHNNYYVSEYGDFDRIQKFDQNGKFLFQWGGHGSGPGELLRPQCLVIDERDFLWVADACNHRIQVFDATGPSAVMVDSWGEAGQGDGQMRYPYALLLSGAKDVYVCEFGNHRLHKFNRNGESAGTFGGPGRDPGQFHQPWSFCFDDSGRLVVLDSYNHRVQVIAWPDEAKKEPN